MGPFDPATDPLWQSMQAGEISERDYWRIRARETGELIGEEWAVPQFLHRIRGKARAVVRPEACTAVAAAKAANKRLAILSNELDYFYGAEFREELPILSAFDLIVDATYTEVLKPDPRAYRFVTKGLGIEAERCVFVDDQLRNVEGAAAVGMKAIHFDVCAPAQSYVRALALLGIEKAVEATA
jgi:putative hydrolase of the HAD superfamily